MIRFIPGARALSPAATAIMVAAFAIAAAGPALAQPVAPDAPLASALALPLEPGFAIEGAICNDGTLVEFHINEAAGVARGLREGKIYTMQREVGHTPPRYVNEETTVEVAPGHLVIQHLDDKPLVCQREPHAPTAGTLWGRIVKRDRMALPAKTTAEVALDKEANGKTEHVASTSLTTNGNQTPYHFLLRYPVARADGSTYTLKARLTDARGRLLYTASAPVLADGAPPEPVMLVAEPPAEPEPATAN